MMRKLIVFSIVFWLLSCNNYVDKPENLIPQDKMAEIIAELSLNDQSNIINTKGNIEAGTRYILKKHKVKAKDFSKSHQYYVFNKKIFKILDQAKEIIEQKKPKAQKHPHK